MIPLVKDVFKVSQDKLTEGDIGVEIEVEGTRLPQPGRFWDTTRDSSLREDGSYEYVLKKPSSKEDTLKALQYLDECYKESNTEVDDSVRAGVHVHINCQDLNILELYNFLVLYLMFEEVLVKFCGDSREGNLFCLRSKDAEYLVHAIQNAIISRNFSEFKDDDLRYASVNVKALTTYGSLEFRSMKGTRDMAHINTWVEILLHLREVARTFKDPEDMLSSYSMEGQLVFARKIFVGFWGLFSEYNDLDKMLHNGMRYAQDIAYCFNWNEFRGGVKPINPFKKNVMGFVYD